MYITLSQKNSVTTSKWLLQKRLCNDEFRSLYNLFPKQIYSMALLFVPIVNHDLDLFIGQNSLQNLCTNLANRLSESFLLIAPLLVSGYKVNLTVLF